MKTNTVNDEPMENRIIEALREGADTEAVFAATRAWSLEKMRLSIRSRGDYFDRNGGIVLELGGEALLQIPVCSLPVTIGRGRQVDFRLDYPEVSRLHCRLESIGNLIRLWDAGSRNGTKLNGRRIDYEDLCDGDLLEIGSLSLRVRRA